MMTIRVRLVNSNGTGMVNMNGTGIVDDNQIEIWAKL